MFYAPTLFAVDASLAPGYTQTTTYVASNDGNATPANSLTNPFPAGVLQPSGNSLGALTAIGSNFNYLDQNRTAGLVQQFSFDIQRELPYGIALEVGYVGSRSAHLQPGTGSGQLNINQVPDALLRTRRHRRDRQLDRSAGSIADALPGIRHHRRSYQPGYRAIRFTGRESPKTAIQRLHIPHHDDVVEEPRQLLRIRFRQRVQHVLRQHATQPAGRRTFTT
jgi:hypothetical protein